MGGERPVEDFRRGERELELLYCVIEGKLKGKHKGEDNKCNPPGVRACEPPIALGENGGQYNILLISANAVAFTL